jgi:hypothetical protein
VQLGGAFSNCLGRDFQTVVDIVCVSVGLPRGAVEAAKLAVGVTDICRIEVSIDIEVGRATVSSSADYVGQLTETRQIVRGVEHQTIFKRETFAARDEFLNLVQFVVM